MFVTSHRDQAIFCNIYLLCLLLTICGCMEAWKLVKISRHELPIGSKSKKVFGTCKNSDYCNPGFVLKK